LEVKAAFNLGEKIKDLRERRNLSLRDLSKKSGVSANALSLIERNRTSPTVSTLVAIANAFNVKVNDFFSDTEKEKSDYVVYKCSQTGHCDIQPLAANLKTQNLNPVMLRLAPREKFAKEVCIHPGDEFVYCLSGSIECEIGDERILLGAGDAITYKGDIPHRINNPSEDISSALVVFEVGRLS
jgi:transcriptional regulator with XRE-family HTH domain